MLLTLDNLNTQKIEIHTLSEDISVIKVVSLLPSVFKFDNWNPSCLEHILS